MTFIRLHAFPILLALALVPMARADDNAGFVTALDITTQHSRAALAHLRAGDVPLAVMEIARLRESFSLLMERYGAARRAAVDDKTAYATTVVDVPLRIVTAQMMIDFGRPDIAANSLLAVCRSLGSLRDPVDNTAPCDSD